MRKSNYKITKNKDSGKFDIQELATERLYASHEDHATAHEQYRFLKNGGAFAGWTPSFMFIPFKTVWDK